jgi:hypothetical protein
MKQFRCCIKYHRANSTNLLIYGVYDEHQFRPDTADT